MSTSEEITTGIVLKANPYKENDALVDVYTLDYGKITMLAKGVKKITSRNAGSIQEMTLSEFTLIPRTGICTLIKASGIQYYVHLKENLSSYLYGTYMLEYILKGTNKNEPDEEIFQCLKYFLEKLDQGIPPMLLYSKFNLMMLQKAGIYLEVDHCAKCGSTNKIVSISSHELGLLCRDCITTQDMIYDKDILRLFRHLVKYPYDRIEEIDYDTVSLKTVNTIIEGLVEEYSGIYFNSKKFF